MAALTSLVDYLGSRHPEPLLVQGQPVLWIRIRIHRIHMFLGLLDLDPDPSVRGMDLDPDSAPVPDPDPSINMQK